MTILPAAAAVLAPVLGAGGMAWAVRGRSSSVFAPSVFHGDNARKALALTFDDGPSESTPALLDLLAAHRIRATFFQCGCNARRLPALPREIVAAGHEIGNHTENHARLWLRSPAFVFDEVARCQRSLEELSGICPLWFRAPFGVRWFGLGEAQRQLGLTGVMWTTLGRDWKLPAAPVAARLLRGARNGAIFCLHDGRGLLPHPDIRETLEALRRAIPALLERGFHFETVSEILCPTN